MAICRVVSPPVERPAPRNLRHILNNLRVIASRWWMIAAGPSNVRRVARRICGVIDFSDRASGGRAAVAQTSACPGAMFSGAIRSNELPGRGEFADPASVVFLLSPPLEGVRDNSMRFPPLLEYSERLKFDVGGNVVIAARRGSVASTRWLSLVPFGQIDSVIQLSALSHIRAEGLCSPGA